MLPSPEEHTKLRLERIPCLFGKWQLLRLFCGADFPDNAGSSGSPPHRPDDSPCILKLVNSRQSQDYRRAEFANILTATGAQLAHALAHRMKERHENCAAVLISVAASHCSGHWFTRVELRPLNNDWHYQSRDLLPMSLNVHVICLYIHHLEPQQALNWSLMRCSKV